MGLFSPTKSAQFAYGSEFYEPSDMDVANTVQYYGYLNNIGKWIIQKIDTGANPQTILYVNGANSYSTAWANRTMLTYAPYNNISNASP